MQHCYVTGGSAGLGLALAVLLTKKGADVSIVARNEERLQKALAEMEVSFGYFVARIVIHTRNVKGSSANTKPSSEVVLLLLERFSIFKSGSRCCM